MTRPLPDIISHIRAVAGDPSIGTTLIQTEDLLALCDAAESAGPSPCASASTIPTCCITGAIPGDGGACGDCDPCIFGEALVPKAVKRLIAEKNNLLQRVGELEDAASIAAEESDTPEREALADIAFAENMLAEHIEQFHDFDYQPHEVPAELASLRHIQHHLAGSLIDEHGNPRTVAERATEPVAWPTNEQVAAYFHKNMGGVQTSYVGFVEGVRYAKRFAASPAAPSPAEALVEQCAKIADPWPGFAAGEPSTDKTDLAVIEVRTKIAAAIRALTAQPATALEENIKNWIDGKQPATAGEKTDG